MPQCMLFLDEAISSPRVKDFIEARLSKDKAVLIVAARFNGISGLLNNLEKEGYNTYLVEFTGIPEQVLLGTSLSEIVEYWRGALTITFTERVSARRVPRSVSRREIIRALMAPYRYLILPQLLDECPSEACPLNAIRRGGVDESRCLGCMLCGLRCRIKPPLFLVKLLVYAYSYVYYRRLDGIVLTCTRGLEELERHVAEAAGLSLAPMHLPCLGWLNQDMLKVLIDAGIHVSVFGSARTCGKCDIGAKVNVVEELVKAGISVRESIAYGMGLPRLPPEHFAEKLLALAGVRGS